MATGAKPALDPLVNTENANLQPPAAKPPTFKERIIGKLTKIFEHNERLGVTRRG